MDPVAAAIWADGNCLGTSDRHGRLRDAPLGDARRQRVQKSGWRLRDRELDGALSVRMENGVMEVVLVPGG